MVMEMNGRLDRAASDGRGSVNMDAHQPKSPIKLDIIVVGAGISGLATAISTALSGHNVAVFESAKELLEVWQTGENWTGQITNNQLAYEQNRLAPGCR